MAGVKGLNLFNSLPRYLGGKRRLLKDIFAWVPPPDVAPVFTDVFLGAGSVSLWAKMRGHRVICNDVAERSHIVGKAVIENSHRKLLWEDVLLLFEPPKTPNDFVQKQFVPGVFMRRQAEWLDRANTRLVEIEAAEGKTQRWWLLKYLVLVYVMRTAPFGTFSAPTTMAAFNAEDVEATGINTSAVLMRNTEWGKWISSPSYAARRLVESTNRIVFDGGRPCEARRQDAIEFLAGVRADVAYFDPPYSGTINYETVYWPLDCVLAGELTPKVKSRFSRDSNLKFLGEVFEAADHIPTWVVSYGNAETELAELCELVGRHRTVESRQIKFLHKPANTLEEDRGKGREFIVVGRPK